MGYKYILSLDPGGTTGVCFGKKIKQGDWDIVTVEAHRKDELYKMMERIVEEFHDKPNEMLVIYETYRLYASKAKAMIGNDFETVQIIGVVKYLCEKHGIKWIDSTTNHKAFFSDKRLKEMGLYMPIDHKRDAIRHFLYWLYFIGKEADIRDLTGTLRSDG